MNDEIERELRKALSRVPAPEGFTDRVLQRLGEENRAERNLWWRMAVAAMVAVALLAGGLRYSQLRHQQEARKAEQDVVFAFSLAAEKLQKVNVRLEQSGPALNIPNKRGRQYE